MVISSPCLTDIKNWLVQSKRLLLASPKQTALGKDISNPLIVDSLLKTIWLSMHHVIAMKHWLFQSKRLLIYSMAGEDEFHDDNPPPPPPPVTPTQQAPHTLSTIKLPILKKGEYDIWAMKMEHYLGHTDYPIWEVIQKGNGPVQVSTDTNGQIRVLPPKTAEEILARERERKARTTLLMSIPEDHLAKFHKMTDAKEIQEDCWIYFKQQFEGFSVSNLEGLHKGYDGFQSLLSQLKIHGAGVSTEDPNQKFLSTFFLVLSSTGSSSSAQNVAFVSSESTSSTNDVSIAYAVSTSSGHNSQGENSSSYTDELMYSFFSNQSSGGCVDWNGHAEDDQENFALMAYSNSGSDTEVTSCSKECVESYAKLKKLYDEQREQLGDASIEIKAYTLALAKVEAQLVCHQKNQLAYEEKIRFMKIDLDDKTDVLTYHKKLLAEAVKEKEELKTKLENFQSSSKGLSKLLNSQMSAKDKSGLGYGDQIHEGVLSYENEVFQSVFDSRSSDVEDSPVYDRFAKVEGMHVVPLPMTGIHMPPGPDKEIDESQFTYGPNQSKTNESNANTSDFNSCESNSSIETLEIVPEQVVNELKVVSQPKVWFDAPIIKEYESDNDDEYVIEPLKELKTPSFAFINTVKRVKTLRETVKQQNTCSQSPKVDKRNWNGLMSKKLGLGHGFTKKACFDDPHKALKNKGIVDSRCSRHMTGNKAYLVVYQDYNGGPVDLGGSKGYITGKENIVPTRGLACLIAKATLDESNKWHRMLGHVNFKNLNKLVKGNLVRGLPSKTFQNDHTYVACQKGKQHKASFPSVEQEVLYGDGSHGDVPKPNSIDEGNERRERNRRNLLLMDKGTPVPRGPPLDGFDIIIGDGFDYHDMMPLFYVVRKKVRFPCMIYLDFCHLGKLSSVLILILGAARWPCAISFEHHPKRGICQATTELFGEKVIFDRAQSSWGLRFVLCEEERWIVPKYA
ncbi:ribonuclease H-like domain-containing protein [Tanacetum coccineum]